MTTCGAFPSTHASGPATSRTWSKRGSALPIGGRWPQLARAVGRSGSAPTPGAYRGLYVATIGDAVYVLHCFQKKTQRTAQADINLAKQRYRQVTEMTRAKEAP